MSKQRDVMLVSGIDVGSSAIKIVVMEDSGDGGARVLSKGTERIRRRDQQIVTADLFQQCVDEANLTPTDLTYTATTGEGETVPFRTGHFYGMTTHARGGLFLDPEARAVLDIGALHTRGVLLDERAKVLSYRMTSQCASGSGQFLENISRYLGITLDEIGPLSLEADNPEACSSICAVLAETDVINMVSRGITTSNIIKGIHQSMAGRYLRLLTSAGASGVTLITGGLANDVGLVQALREAAAEQKKSTLEIRAHEDSVYAGALGAALWGAFRARKLAARGISLGTAAPA
ncbi:MAG: benzoyl-CoA reductase subunit D [Candidatus Krumholzibacteria bacterium]|nr:benzoyl-CoA reductase subunit D [Candidatus Krumholzibacteria bacterium]MDH4335813.1 benzoyl-CoA reductase subunit D [Candidatus Krumholzibacteria bacterium]MDH5269339.1 benzoyl-CoA reductase subunit D [Candidatus Krumholzibacteria bacterium]